MYNRDARISRILNSCQYFQSAFYLFFFLFFLRPNERNIRTVLPPLVILLLLFQTRTFSNRHADKTDRPLRKVLYEVHNTYIPARIYELNKFSRSTRTCYSFELYMYKLSVELSQLKRHFRPCESSRSAFCAYIFFFFHLFLFFFKKVERQQ